MKRYLLSLCAAFCLLMGVQAQNQMHVNMKDGSVMNIFVSEIESVTWDATNDESEDNNPDDPTATGDAINITSYSATIEGYANNVRDNDANDLKIGIIYCAEGTPNKSNGIQKTVYKSDVASDGKYTIKLTNLGPGTTYYYRSFVYQSGLWFYGKVRSFTTTGLIFSTDAATSITCFSAKVSAKINTPSTVSLSEYGICYGTSNEPTNRQRITTKADDGTVSATLRALEGNTVYYYRPYAVVNGVVSYGQTFSFKTLADNVVTTGEIDAEGNVRSRLTIGGGAYSLLEVGLCWSTTNETPTVEDKTIYTNEVDDENYFSVRPDFYIGKYYYRSYVKIDGVAHYGEIIILEYDVRTKSIPAGNAIDLGLSVKWADMNVGASTPEGYGYYYAWGETEPKAEYSWNTYFDYSVDASNFGKYATNKKTTLAPEDDAAHVNWGGAWRMPTKAEMDELYHDCTWTWTSQNGVNGYKVVGPNGNSLFLPATGSRDSSNLDYVEICGFYWTSSLCLDSPVGNAFGLGFRSNSIYSNNKYSRHYGYAVRPVCQ